MALASLYSIRGDGNQTYAQNITRYFRVPINISTGNATESVMQRRVRTTGTYSNLACRVSANSIGATSTITFRIDAGDGNMTQSITADGTGIFEDSSNTDAVSAGEDIAIELVTGADGADTITLSAIGTLFTASSNTVTSFGFAGTTTTASSTLFSKLASADTTFGATETANLQYRTKAAGTFKNMDVNVITARATTSTAGVRVNGGSSSIAVSLTGGVTGHLEDSSNTAAVVVDDLINFYLTTGTGTDSGSYAFYVDFENTGGVQPFYTAFNTATVNANLTRYYPPQGGQNNAAETNEQMKTGIDGDFSMLQVYVGTWTMTDPSTVTLRVGGAGSALAASILGTGWSIDDVDTVTVDAADLIAYEITTGVTGTSLTVDFVSSLFEEATPPPGGGSPWYYYTQQG